MSNSQPDGLFVWVQELLGPSPQKWSADHWKGKEAQKGLPLILQKHYLNQEEWSLTTSALAEKYPLKVGG